MNVDFLLFEVCGPDGLQRPLGGFPDREPSAGKAGEPAAFSMVAFTVDGEPVTSYGGCASALTVVRARTGWLVVRGHRRGPARRRGTDGGDAASSGRTVASVCTRAFLLTPGHSPVGNGGAR